jgi:putative DNA primase/helicase
VGITELKELKNTVDILNVIGNFVPLKKAGRLWEGCCPFHKENTPSFKVDATKKNWHCFGGCGVGGDVFDFLIRYHGYNLPEAIADLKGTKFTRLSPSEQMKQTPPNDWVPLLENVPQDHTPNHYKLGKPNAVYAYHDAHGYIITYICRFNKPGGKKDNMPLSFCQNKTEYRAWRWQGLLEPRPLYNLHKIAADKTKSKPVLIVEGEKTADAAGKLFPEIIVTCWMFGSGAQKAKTDWSPLYGRKIIFWPDNDLPGTNAMLEIMDLLKDHCTDIEWVKNPKDADKGWDVADADWTEPQAQQYLVENLFVPSPPEAESPEDVEIDTPEFVPVIASSAPVYTGNSGPANGQDYNSDDHFTFLGWEKTESGTLVHYFFPRASKAVLKYPNTALQSMPNLLNLAPLQFWQGTFGNAKKVSDTLVQYLVETSTHKGPFSPSRIRGRGAWLDGKDIIVHSGDYLIVNGVKSDLASVKSRHIYEHTPHLGFQTTHPLKAQSSKKLFDLCELLNWERSLDAYLLAGWVVIAPVCGALPWRPHIWLTGGAGTGKSTVFRKVVRRFLGEIVLAVQGDTTEAGLRQSLRNDALPVVFDEADTDDRRSSERIQNNLSLARSSSSDDGGVILKGSANHNSTSFSIRSCFAFASINVKGDKESDRSRVSILALKKLADDNERRKRWEEFNRQYNDIVTDEFVSRLQARTLALLPKIIKNSQVFANAAAAVMGGQRIGDQLGSMLAGAYSLVSSGEVTYDFALKWIQDKNWTEEMAEESSRDEMQLFQIIVGETIEVEAGDFRKLKRTIGELITIAHKDDDLEIKFGQASDVLKRMGIKMDGDFIAISNSAPYMQKMLKDTAWYKNHSKTLMRIPGAKRIDSTKFAPGIQTRAVGIPFSVLEGEYKPLTA